MISRLCIFWLVLAAIAGATVFHVSQEAQHAEKKLRRINAEIRTRDESLRVLRAEWFYLTQPARLLELSKKYFPDYVPMTGAQMTQLADVSALLAPPPDENEVPKDAQGTLVASPAEAAPATAPVKPAALPSDAGASAPSVKNDIAARAADMAAISPAAGEAGNEGPSAPVPHAPAAPPAPPVQQQGGHTDFNAMLRSLGDAQ